MTITVKHKFVSAKVDTLDNSKIQPSNWNDTHSLQVAGGVVVGRAAGAGQADATELPMGAMGQSLIASADAAAVRTLIVADATETTIQGKAVKATPVDADTIVITDSAAANVLKRITWASVKATLKAYFDALYLASSYIPTWASITGKPTTVAGYGITDVDAHVIGVGQTWQDVTSLRTYNVSYQNNTAKPIMVSIAADAGGSGRWLQTSVDNVNWVNAILFPENGTDYSIGTAIIPAGLYYKIIGNYTIQGWSELR